jgi:hypothetical protein
VSSTDLAVGRCARRSDDRVGYVYPQHLPPRRAPSPPIDQDLAFTDSLRVHINVYVWILHLNELLCRVLCVKCNELTLHTYTSTIIPIG